MNITEKLRKLTEHENKAATARKAGLKPTQLNDYTTKGFKPRYDIALKIGRALGAPIEWLMDDEADWPPESVAKLTAADLPDRELMLELAKRYRNEILPVVDAIEACKKEDWKEIRAQLEAWKPGMPESEAMHRVRAELRDLFSITLVTMRFALAYFAMANHQSMPGKDQPVERFDPRVMDEFFRDWSDNEDAQWVVKNAPRLSQAAPEWPRTIGQLSFADGTGWSKSNQSATATDPSSSNPIQPPIEPPPKPSPKTPKNK